MKIALTACLFFLSFCLHAQDSIVHAPLAIDSFVSVQVEARFPGGAEGWRAFLEQHIHPNTAANHKAPPGNYTVVVSFLVDTVGKVSDVQIVQDAGYGTAEDVLKVFKHSPNWLPATINGKPVIFRQKQNITYQVTAQ